jgi:hypothetical protein
LPFVRAGAVVVATIHVRIGSRLLFAPEALARHIAENTVPARIGAW